MNVASKIFTNEKIVIFIVVLNSLTIYIQECGFNNSWLDILDMLFNVFFIIEMVLKHVSLGFKGYWADGWNRLDGTLVIIALPSIVMSFLPVEGADVSFLLTLRTLRVFRFFRLVHAFPNFTKMMKGLAMAMRHSYGIFLGFFIVILIFALISSALFREACPDHFGTPNDAMYSIFRLFTFEGWHEIPDAVAVGLPSLGGSVARVYFILLIVAGGVIGMSLVNSIFVDAMMSANEEKEQEQKEKEERMDRIEAKLDEILRNTKKD